MTAKTADGPTTIRPRGNSKYFILVALGAALAFVLYLKSEDSAATHVEKPSLANAATELKQPGPEAGVVAAQKALPKLVDLGAGKCIPCKAMAPILEDLRKTYQGQFDVQFIDVWEDPDAATQYGVQVIPTQIFYDAGGAERFRHEGFFAKEDILAKWGELNVALAAPTANETSFARWEPATPDTRTKDSVCYLCDGEINPKTRAVLKTVAGDVAFCSVHCYLITYASLTDESKSHDNVSVTDWSSGRLLPVTSSCYLYGVDARGRPTIKAFADEAGAKAEQQNGGGNVLAWAALIEKELATRCAFCDRPVYPEDACVVRVQGVQTWGCCPMCALGVAARMEKDIEVDARDALSGETVSVKTYQGHVEELAPETSVAWAGSKRGADGKVASTGCFKQAFFANEANLRKWVEEHPLATGRLVSIEQALTEKMKLTPQQISKACKIGECTPK